MKILHVIPSLNPATGGPPMVAASLAAAQAALGCEAGIVAYDFPNAAHDVQIALKNIPYMLSVAVGYLPQLTRYERIFARDAKHRAVPLVEQADLIHLHGVWDPLIAVFAAVARRKSTPYVLTPHGMLDPWALAQKPHKKKLAMLLGYRGMLDRAAFLHFLNADEQSLAEPLGLLAPTRVVPNGIFTQEVDPLPIAGAFRSAHPTIGKHQFILFLSRLHHKKGLDYLADAFAIVAKQFPHAQLVVAGPDAGARADFERQIRSLTLSNRVHLVGPLYGQQKLQAMVDCDCFCLPSRQEGFSLAITEAMACQVPVVISTACHFPEVEQAKAGIITELDPAAIAAAIASILSDPPGAQRMGWAGRDLVHSRFTWPKVAQQMIDAYTSLASLAPLSPPAPAA
jgi:glycosyltransferase involved in cell wall biosynthesis